MPVTKKKNEDWVNSPRDALRGDGRSLDDDLEIQQLKTFTRWWNSWLVERQLTTDDLCEDIKLGVLPIELFEILSRSSCGRYVKAPKTSFQKLDNFNIFLEQLKSKSIKLANIGAEDLAGGVRKAVLGLTWTLILTYEVNKLLGEKAGINDLLNWVKEKVKPYGVILEGGWQKGFADGQAFCALGIYLSTQPVPFHRARARALDALVVRLSLSGAYLLRLHASVHLHVCGSARHGFLSP